MRPVDVSVGVRNLGVGVLMKVLFVGIILLVGGVALAAEPQQQQRSVEELLVAKGQLIERASNLEARYNEIIAQIRMIDAELEKRKAEKK